MGKATWTEERDNELRACFASGMSLLETAISMSASKGGIQGRAARMGLKSNNARGAAGHRKNNASAPAAIPSRPSLPRFTEAGISMLRCVEITPLNLELVHLEKGQCRFPYGDGPFTFCGHPALTGRSYCGPHTAAAVIIVAAL